MTLVHVTPTAPSPPEAAHLVRVATCGAGHTYDAMPRGADPVVFETWYEAHRLHREAE